MHGMGLTNKHGPTAIYRDACRNTRKNDQGPAAQHLAAFVSFADLL
jgi:hypothetical protein